jgi:hypothetical protein
MVKVTETIKKIMTQRTAGLVDGEESTRKLLVDLNRQVQDELGRAALGSWDAYHLKQVRAALERRLADYESAAKSDLGKRLEDMWDLGQKSVYQALNDGGIFTGFNIPGSIIKQMEEFAFVKIDSYTGAMWNRIRGELSLGGLGAKTPQQVADAIGKLLPEGPMMAPSGRTIFADAAQRAEFITKTELGRNFSEAADRRMQDAAKYVSDLLKVWRHGHPKQPRPTHLAADGQERPLDKPFGVRDKKGYQLMRPHDPQADFSEVAGCLCTHFTWAKRWGDTPQAA